jgi:hypothetical protein
MTKHEDTTTGEPLALRLSDGLGPNAQDVERVLRELDDTTNQTWRSKRARWAALVRKQAAELDALRTQLAHWRVFGEHAEGERSRLKHNEAVMMDALYKACADDEEMVRQTIESQGVLRCDHALLASSGA